MQYDYIVKHSFSVVEYDPETHEQLNSHNFERGDQITGDVARQIEKDDNLMQHVRRVTPRPTEAVKPAPSAAPVADRAAAASSASPAPSANAAS